MGNTFMVPGKIILGENIISELGEHIKGKGTKALIVTDSFMRVLTDPADTGAVCIALPQDVEGEAYDYPDYFFQKRVHHIDRRLPSARAVREAVELIQKKKKPMMIFGGGVKYSEAEETFRKFAEKYNIPFGETQAGRGCITWEHPMPILATVTKSTMSWICGMRWSRDWWISWMRYWSRKKHKQRNPAVKT